MRIFAGVRRRGGVKRQWGYRQRQFSAVSLAISLETVEIRPELLDRDTEPVVASTRISKCVTLNDLEWLFHVKFCFRASVRLASETAIFESKCVKTNKDRSVVSAAKKSTGMHHRKAYWNSKILLDYKPEPLGSIWGRTVIQQFNRLELNGDRVYDRGMTSFSLCTLIHLVETRVWNRSTGQRSLGQRVNGQCVRPTVGPDRS